MTINCRAGPHPGAQQLPGYCGAWWHLMVWGHLFESWQLHGMSSLNNVCIFHLLSSPEPIQQWAGVVWAPQLSDQLEHQPDQASSLLWDTIPSFLSLNMIRVPRKTLLNLPMDYSQSCRPPNAFPALYPPLLQAFQYFSFEQHFLS